jgi:hypothetical protein
MVISKGANQMCYLVKGEDHGIAVHPYELNHSLSQNLLVNDGDHFTPIWLHMVKIEIKCEKYIGR